DRSLAAVRAQANCYVCGDAEIATDAPRPNDNTDRMRDVEAGTDLHAGHDVHAVAADGAVQNEGGQQAELPVIRGMAEAVEDGGTQSQEAPDEHRCLAKSQWLREIAVATSVPSQNVLSN